MASVYNDRLETILKFRRLLGSLEGTALRTIQSIRVLESNFEHAWNTLCERYDNKPLRFALQMQALEKLPNATKESAKHLTNLLNTVEESINTFQELKGLTKHWDDIISYLPKQISQQYAP